jgi:hypothetical protein
MCNLEKEHFQNTLFLINYFENLDSERKYEIGKSFQKHFKTNIINMCVICPIETKKGKDVINNYIYEFI